MGSSLPLLLDRLRRHRLLAVGLAGATLLFVLVLRLRRPPTPSLTFAPTEISLYATRSAQHHLALADDYQRKLWCSDALDELGRALKDAPALRGDAEPVRIAIPCLRAKTQTRTVRFLVDQLGAAAAAPLAQALATETRPDVREGLTRALAELPPPGAPHP